MRGKHFDRGSAIAYRIGVVINEFTHILIGRGLRSRLGHALAFLASFESATALLSVGADSDHVAS